MELAIFPHIALVLGIVCLISAALIFVLVYGLRLRSLSQLKKQAYFQALWGDVFEACFWGEAPRELPTLPSWHRIRFIRLWNHYQSVMEGESRGRLNRLAFRLGLDKHLKPLVNSHHLPTKLEAITMVGYLRLKVFWSPVVKACLSHNTYVSLVAAQSLVLMDPAKALSQVILPMMIKRKDWPTTRLGLILARSGVDVLSKPLAMAIRHAPASQLPRLIGYLELIDRDSAYPVLIKHLKQSRDEEVLAQCLHVLSLYEHPADASVFRLFVKHPNWHVRIKAMVGLGKTGQDRDANVLIPQLGHAQWWVRYRAAKALTELPAMTEQRLKRVRDTQVTDRYGKDILTQVMAERDWHIQTIRGASAPTSQELATRTGMGVPDLLREGATNPFGFNRPPRTGVPNVSSQPDESDKAAS